MKGRLDGKKKSSQLGKMGGEGALGKSEPRSEVKSAEAGLLRADAFWSFSHRLYARPGFADAALALQDKRDADINLLLFALFLAARHIRLRRSDLVAIEMAIRDWRESVLKPMRDRRRRLARRKPALKADLLALELEAERIAQRRILAAYKTAIARHPPLKSRRPILPAANLRLYLGDLKGAEALLKSA